MEKKLLKESLTTFYKNLGVKNPEIIAESKATQAQGLNILKRLNVPNPEEIIGQLRNIDKSNNQKNIAAMAYLYGKGEDNIQSIDHIFQEYETLVAQQRVNPLQLTKKGIFIRKKKAIGQDKLFQDYISFSEFIHDKMGELNRDRQGDEPEDTDSTGDLELMGVDEEPIFSNEHFDIYDGNDVGKCIKYGQGGLTGEVYQWCITKPGNTNFQSYRDTKISTFYFILDKTRPVKDPLHLVVYDVTHYGVEITDRNNSAPTKIAEFGSDTDAYADYLRKKGVPVDELLVNHEKTPEEEAEEKKLGRANSDLQWFIDLDYEEKSKYIGRGHTLTNDQFDYLLSTL
jgi:hypothetical protein